jgi:hypothetical protein
MDRTAQDSRNPELSGFRGTWSERIVEELTNVEAESTLLVFKEGFEEVGRN